MKLLLHIFLFLLQWTYGIVQNVVGLMLFAYYKVKNPSCRSYFYHGTLVCHWDKRDSMGMGMFIFFGHHNSPDAEKVLAHEYGHIIQSRITGPLYLLVIGIPSYMWAHRKSNIEKRRNNGISYYSYYTEKWRNSLARLIIGEKTPD